MSFDWIDFLAVAEKLKNAPGLIGPEEAVLRSSVSRAYYAAWHYALRFAQDRRESAPYLPYQDGRDHSGVKWHFLSSPNSTRRKVGRKLDRLLIYRHMADYDLVLSEPADGMAEASLKNAKSVLEILNSLRS